MRVKRRQPVQNRNTPKHASCLQQGTKVKLKKFTLCAEYKVLLLGQIQHITEHHSSSMVVTASYYGYARHRQELGSFPTDTGRQIHLSAGQ
jgi:hypothetical protein